MKATVILMILAVTVSACNKKSGTDDLQSFTENAFKDRILEIEPLPPLRPTAVFIYTASDQVDPFNSGNLRIQIAKNENTGGGEAEPDETRRKEPLEAYPIDALKMVGVMAKNGIDWAIIKAPDQTVHRVTEGNYIGENLGEIIRINGNKMEVVELVKNPVGKWEKKNVNLILVE